MSTTANEIATRLIGQLQSDQTGIPLILTDAAALGTAADRVLRSGAALDDALRTVSGRWSALPNALVAPGAVERLYSAMSAPAEQAHDLHGIAGRLSKTLHDYAGAVQSYRRQFDHLRDRAEQLLARASTEVHDANPVVADYSSVTPVDASTALAADEAAFQSDLDRAREAWATEQRTIRERLESLRNGIDPELLTGSTRERTAGLRGGRDALGAHGVAARIQVGPLPPVDLPTTGMMLGLQWLVGAPARHRVFDGDSDFAKQVRGDRTWLQGSRFDPVTTMQEARRAARIELSDESNWAVGTPLRTPQGRSLTGGSALPTFLNDAGTVAVSAETLGLVDLGTDETFLGSYGVEMVPIAVVGTRKVLIRVTVTNATTLASGTRIPGLESSNDAFGHWKNTVVANGPASEQTQTVTWTEVLSYPPTNRRRTDHDR